MTIKTIWKNTKETEVQRLAQIAAQIGNRFYLKNGFLVLPFLVKNNPSTVFLPPLGYPKILFEKTASLELSIPMKVPEKLLKTLSRLLSYKEINFQKQKSSWEKIEKKFWQSLFKILPEATKIKELEIWSTNFGSITSFHLEKNKIFVWLRKGGNISHLAEAIISAIILNKNYFWREKEAIVDFLLKESSLARLFPKYKPTLLSLKKENKILEKESLKYLASLGVKVGEIFKIKRGQIFCDEKLIPLDLFTTKERKLLKLFIKKKNNVVSFDELANPLWKDEERFSLWAIAKRVERLRKKFSELNLSPELLQTKRGEGYFLMD